MTTIMEALIAHATVTSESFGHEIDRRTYCCRRCGASAQQLMENDVPDCHQGSNIVGLNHHRSLRWGEALFSSFSSQQE